MCSERLRDTDPETWMIFSLGEQGSIDEAERSMDSGNGEPESKWPATAGVKRR